MSFSHLSSKDDQWFNCLTTAWRTAWRDGVFPNPSQVRLCLDLDQTSTEDTEDWRLTLANLWSDLLLRRVADFASGLFHTFRSKSTPDFQFSSTLLGWIFKVSQNPHCCFLKFAPANLTHRFYSRVIEPSDKLCSDNSGLCASPILWVERDIFAGSAVAESAE